MSHCAEVRPMISFFLEKETGPLETLQTSRHLDECPACSRRARRLAGLMEACDRIPAETGRVDVARGVMERLRAIKLEGSRRGFSLSSAKWSGLGLVVLGLLTGLTSPAHPVLRALGRPFSLLVGIFGGAEGDGMSGAASRALPLAVGLIRGGSVRPELPASAATELVVSLQLLATALLVSLLVALPAAALTAYLLRRGSSQSFPRL